MGAFSKEDLIFLQSKSLEEKQQISLARIGEWFNHWDYQVYVAFSGGKDSTVLADLCAKWCYVIGKPLYLCFVDTGLEFPEIRTHVKYFAEWLKEKYEIEVILDIIRPKKTFLEVLEDEGYPIISKSVSNCVRGAKMGQKSRINLLNGKDCDGSDRKSKFSKLKYKPLLDVDFDISDRCCDIMKKQPSKQYQKTTGRKPILATMAVESMLRESAWLKNGCNAFEAKTPHSTPMAFWTEQDVLRYIKNNNVPIASVYGEIVRADCVVNDGVSQYEQMSISDFGLIENDEAEILKTTGYDRTGCMFCGFGCHLEKDGDRRFENLKKTHPRQYKFCIGGGKYNEKGVWKPTKKGIGLGHVFDELNKIYGDDFIKY